MIGRYIDSYAPEEDVYPPPHLRPLQIGVDVGKMTDPTAFAVAELNHGQDERRPTFSIVRLERVALHTSYPQIADRLVEAVRNIRQQGVAANRHYVFGRDRYLGDNLGGEQRAIEMMVDATGVGRPLVDLIDDRMRDLDVRVRAVTFRAGEALTKNGSEWSMGKGFMVNRLQVLLQCSRVAIPATHQYAGAIKQEIHNYEIHLGEQGKATYGARQGQHDDMVHGPRPRLPDGTRAGRAHPQPPRTSPST